MRHFIVKVAHVRRLIAHGRRECPNMGESEGFLLDTTGSQVGLSGPWLDSVSDGDANQDVIADAIVQRGWVLIQIVRRLVFVELCPRRVAPLAALEALYKMKETSAECAVLVYLGNTWRRSRYEIFSPAKGALQKMDSFARSARIKAAADLDRDCRRRNLARVKNAPRRETSQVSSATPVSPNAAPGNRCFCIVNP
jgi:hypothetical protein